MGIIALLFFLAYVFLGGNERAMGLYQALSLTCIGVALIVSVLLVCRQAIYDKINGWSVIGLQATLLVCLFIHRQTLEREPRPTAQSSSAAQPNRFEPVYSGGQGDPYQQRYYTR